MELKFKAAAVEYTRENVTVYAGEHGYLPKVGDLGEIEFVQATGLPLMPLRWLAICVERDEQRHVYTLATDRPLTSTDKPA